MRGMFLSPGQEADSLFWFRRRCGHGEIGVEVGHAAQRLEWEGGRGEAEVHGRVLRPRPLLGVGAEQASQVGVDVGGPDAQGVSHREESLGRYLLAAALHLGEVRRGEAGLRGDLAQGPPVGLAPGAQDRAQRSSDRRRSFAVGEIHLSWANDTTKGWSAHAESWTRRRRHGVAFDRGGGPPAAELELDALFAARHRPPVVGLKDRPYEEGPVAQQWFFCRDSPVVGGLDVLAVLPDRPDSRAYEVALGTELESVGRVGLCDGEPPAQRVGKPAFRVQADDAPDMRRRVAWRELPHAKVYGRPPAAQPSGTAQDFGDLFRGGPNSPARKKRILGRHAG